MSVKRPLSALMSAVLAVGLMPSAAFAADASTGADLAAASIEAQELETQATSAELAATFTFSDAGIVVSGATSTEGYSINETNLKITAPGAYKITGSCSQGNLSVAKGTTGVTLLLEDLSLASSTAAPLAIKKNNGDVAVVVSGNVTLADKEDIANDTDDNDDFDGAALKVGDGSNLTIAGSGALMVDGSACKNAIKAGESTLAINMTGTASAKAANNAIASDDTVIIAGGTVNVEATNKGIKAGDGDSTELGGTILISGGTVNVTATDDGIHANGIPDVTAGTVNGGNVTISGGTVTVSSGDDGVKADGVLTVGAQGATSGPTLKVTKANEGLEGAIVNLYSGDVDITASDDGINAANSDFGGGDMNSTPAFDFVLNVAGGTLKVNAEGDGLDSNKHLLVSGGTATVFGSSNDGNAALDYGDSQGSVFQVTGGELIAVGMSGMAVVPTSGTYVAFGAGGMGNMGGMPGGMGNMGGMPRAMGATGNVNITAGAALTIADSSGSQLFSATAVKSANSVVFLSPSLQSGQSYTLSANGSALATASAVQGNSSSSVKTPTAPSTPSLPDLPASYSAGEKAASSSATDSGASTDTSAKKTQTITVKKTTKKIYYTKLRVSNRTVKVLKVSGAKTDLVYKKLSVSKLAKRFTVNSSTGKITVKKGTPKGKYVVRMKVYAKASDSYARSNIKTVNVVVKVV